MRQIISRHQKSSRAGVTWLDIMGVPIMPGAIRNELSE